MDVAAGIKKLQRFARRLGGDVVVITWDQLREMDTKPQSDEEFSGSPFSISHGISWNKRIVYVAPDSGEDPREIIGGIIHELGHVLASKDPPNKAMEFEFFFWEYRVAERLGLQEAWEYSTHNYGVDGDGSEWGPLKPEERKKVLVEAKKDAMKAGVIRRGLPVSIRT
jgi:hypothetical protein